MAEDVPDESYKVLLRLTLETGREHAGASAQLAGDVGTLRDEMAAFRTDFSAHSAKEAEWKVAIDSINAFVAAQQKAALDAQAGAAHPPMAPPGLLERWWTSFTTAMESTGVRTVFIAIAVPVLTTIGLGIVSAITGIKFVVPQHDTTIPAVVAPVDEAVHEHPPAHP